MVRTFPLFMICLAALLTSRVAIASIHSVSPSDDRFGQDSPKDGDFAIVGNGDRIAVFNFVPDVGPSNEGRAALEFDIAAIPPSATIISAVLTLVDDADADRAVELHGYIGDGVIAPGDFLVSSLLIGDITDGLNGSDSFDVASFIQSIVNSAASFAGFMLKEPTPTTDSNPAYRFLSLENASSTERPLLTIEYADATGAVPEAASVLVWVGLIAVASTWHRQR